MFGIDTTGSGLAGVTAVGDASATQKVRLSWKN